ncbi:S1/P1 nuclease [Microbulbifer halophilus]|uniref:S1/P1 nuclease n=1 Tax=Microbulbifer halophilus TaxID=453963 RepID=A0ABW5ECC3_9GAMM|nr:S1/P1 nuclease [Microbulbifer halophilus]MCW8125989.1 S1/P1 nuclease [Microbulbifer halophilus]
MKIANNVFRVALLVVMIAAAPRVFAWGGDGHRVVGELARFYLEPDTREKVERLLDSVDEPSLAEASTWADRIRSDDSYDWAAPLHYINLPKDWQGYDEKRDCPPAGCLLKAIERFEGVLGDRSATETARAEALMFLAHFVGDLHQPMHVGLREDRGGNDVEVTFFGFDTNLHWLWDSKLPAGFIGDWRIYAEEAAEEITPEQRAAWRSGTVEDWAAESHELAHRYAYTDRKALGEDYYLRNRDRAARRLHQGGVRAALLIEQALDGN